MYVVLIAHNGTHHDPPPHPQSQTVMSLPEIPSFGPPVLTLCTTTNSVNTNCEALTDANFQTAVDLWISDPTQTTIDYGHIKDW